MTNKLKLNESLEFRLCLLFVDSRLTVRDTFALLDLIILLFARPLLVEFRPSLSKPSTADHWPSFGSGLRSKRRQINW